MREREREREHLTTCRRPKEVYSQLQADILTQIERL